MFFLPLMLFVSILNFNTNSIWIMTQDRSSARAMGSFYSLRDVEAGKQVVAISFELEGDAIAIGCSGGALLLVEQPDKQARFQWAICA